MGHGLNNTLQDVLVRYKRMDGYNTLWLPGTDHAGIATQNVVEKHLAAQGQSRQKMGRQQFIQKVWEWKEQYGNTIINQLKRLGSSCDWSRQRFTMDEGLSRAVRAVFVRLYKEDLVYRGTYMVNWCIRCETALADEEVEHEEQKGKLYYIRYPVEDSEEYVVVATTRPETMLGDTALAVNPDDDRYRHLIGKKAILPVIGRKLPIFADEYVEKEFGTGIVKMTPAHDPNDFLLGKKHGLEEVKVIDDRGRMTSEAGPYEGEDRYLCRENLLKDLQQEGLIDRIEDYVNKIGSCYRCHTVIEPLISDQWFVKMKPLAEPAIEAVKSGKIKFVPERWTRVYLHWMENIRDWCISRQIWWGHRIPVWYCRDCGHLNVEEYDPEKCEKCGSQNLRQDEDVLDTWFSSWLWPFSTLGWPDKTEDLDVFYPTDVLVTDPGIIFFWVARMIMAGMKFMQEIPFHTVYIHGTVRDEQGRKMSKSLGNGIDPIEMIEKYSADAMRFSLMMLTSEGQDVNLSESKFEMGRNFGNKIWNASRFVLMNANFPDNPPDISSLQNNLEIADKWILQQLEDTIKKVRRLLDSYNFNESAHTLYNFTWHDFCDWYVELIKVRLYRKEGHSEKDTMTALYTAMKVLDSILRLLHPFMPFITEEIRHIIADSLPENWKSSDDFKHLSGPSICVDPFPAVSECSFENEARSMELITEIIYNVRKIRGEMNISPNIKNDLYLLSEEKSILSLFRENERYFRSLIPVEKLVIAEEADYPASASEHFCRGVKLAIPVPEEVLDAEIQRLNKEISKLEKEIFRLDKKLSNEQFIQKAPPQVVEKEKEKFEEYSRQFDFLKEQLAKLSS